MEGYKYPVFFEVPSLDPAQKEKLEKYFQVRRKSGGGDCGPIDNVGDNVYKIAFIDRTGIEILSLLFELYLRLKVKRKKVS
jgi:hypothetical protein